MISIEKVLRALAHQAGPMPVDCGATATTGMHCSCVAQLRDYYGLEKRPVKIHEPYQMLGWIDDDLAIALGVDTVMPMPSSTMFGYANENWKLWRTPWGQEVFVGDGFTVDENNNGNIYIYPAGDRQAAPSGHLPAGGFFFDAIIKESNFNEDEPMLEDNLEEFPILSMEFLKKMHNSLKIARNSGRAVITNGPGCALGDVALIPATWLKNPKGIRDVSLWYMSTAIHQDFIHQIFTAQTDIAIKNLTAINHECGELIDIIFLCGTDFGSQTSQFCSVQTFRELYLPYYRKMTEWIHTNTRWKIFKHSCGSIMPLLPSIIEAGFDIINPVQCSAANMNPEELKEKFGRQITFWGAGVDTQHVLPFGSPEEVSEQVKERCKIFSADGGFVFNSIHNIQALTPLENIVAMFETAKKFNNMLT